jgi:predicted RNA-binding protein Jag
MNGMRQTTAEGHTVADALKKAAADLGVDISLVQHKLDMSHFKTADGRSRAVDTVKIIAWAKDPSSAQGAIAARDWLKGLLHHMGVEGTIAFRVNGDKAAELRIDSPRARHLVGRRGSTLYAITWLMEASLAPAHPGWTWRLSVEGGDDRDERPRHDDDRPRRDDDRPRRDDDRPRRDDDRPRRDDDRPRHQEDRPRRDDDRPRHEDDRPRHQDDRPRQDDDRPRQDDDRPRQDDGRRDDRPRREDDRGPRRDDRGPRRDDRGPRRDDRGPRDSSGPRSDRDVERLKELARKLAATAIESGDPQIIRKPLNSFERRVVHVEIAEIQGVVSESQGDGALKTILIRPRRDGEGEGGDEG